MTLAVQAPPEAVQKFRLPIPLLDSYVLGLLLRPSAVCMGVTLVAMLLERVLRLINEMAASGAHLGYLYGLIFNLIPYYLGLALPASFFVSLFMVISRLDDGNEIDPMLASGRSMSRIATPLIATGVVFAIISLLLYGFLEPFGRYGYREVRNEAMNAGWTAQIQSQVFLSAGQELTITADRVDATGRKLHGVFIRRSTAKGETIITAKTGRLSLSPDRKFTQVQLDQGLQYSDLTTGGGRVLGFDNISILEPSSMAGAVRPRGGDERELTLFELVRELRDP
ncbi:MAG: LptF/LptG family permease, partial [Acetobacteraceae bacterium]|nr:LptF/LptG family permease [Acetobacteraceae bacterium]